MANRGGWLTQLPAGAVRQVHRRLEIVDASRVLAAQARRRRDADSKRQRTRCRRGGLRRTFRSGAAPAERRRRRRARGARQCAVRSEEHTSELQSLMRISYAVFCLKQKLNQLTQHTATLVHHNYYNDSERIMSH